MAAAGGASRRPEQVPGQAGRTAPVAGVGGPVPGSGLGGSCGPGRGLVGCREWRCGRLAWIIVGQALSARCVVPLAG
jgi:hypothetical protein